MFCSFGISTLNMWASNANVSISYLKLFVILKENLSEKKNVLIFSYTEISNVLGRSPNRVSGCYLRHVCSHGIILLS